MAQGESVKQPRGQASSACRGRHAGNQGGFGRQGLPANARRYGSGQDCRPAVLWLALLAAFAPPAQAASDLETWGHVAVTLAERPRHSWSVFGALRVRGALREAYDRRGGVSVRVPAAPRAVLSAGVLARAVRPAEDGFRREYWIFGGPTITIWQGWLMTKLGAQAERHLVASTPDFNRYRLRVDAERRRRGLSPFVFEEATILNGGIVRWRTRAGGRYRLRSGSLLEVAYQFETIKRGSAWRPRHAMHLRLNLRLTAEEP